MSTLVVKLAATFVKQLSKPMAKVFTSYVMRKPELRKTIVDLSQRVHKFNVRLAHYGENRRVIVGEMVEDKAVEMASSMVSETFIYSIAAGAVYWEYTRSAAASEEKKEQERLRHEQLVQAADEQRKMLHKQNQEQFAALELLADRVSRLEQLSAEKEGRSSFWKRNTSASVSGHLDPDS